MGWMLSGYNVDGILKMSISSTLTLLKLDPHYPIWHKPLCISVKQLGQKVGLLGLIINTCAGLNFRVSCTGLRKRWALGCVNMQWKIVFPALTARRRTLHFTSYLYNHNLNTATY